MAPPLPESSDLGSTKLGIQDKAMLTVGLLIDSFETHLTVQHKIGETSAATTEWYKSQLKKLRASVGPFPAAQLRAEHLVACEFTNHFVRVLKSLYAWASSDDVELVSRNPFRKLKTPPCGERQRVLTDPEVLDLYRSASPVHFRRVLFMLLHTIARPGELRTLKWESVDLERRVLVLNKFKAKDQRKDGKKIRFIPLDRAVTNWLAKRFKMEKPKPEDFVFTSRFGEAWTSNAFRCAMRRARKKAGLKADANGERIVCYSFRHTAATHAVRNGVTEGQLAEVMGHTSTQMTKRYVHRNEGDLVNVIERATRR